MCGIVGYTGPLNAAQIIMDGLRKLEYRGYDSAGIAVVQDGNFAIRRDVGKLSNLAIRLAESPIEGEIGIGHTRWATHGKPSERNAHPHTDASGQIVVVQNGIVENFRELRAELEAEGITFNSDTDTEVIAHLIGLHYAEGNGLAEAVRLALLQLRGPQRGGGALTAGAGTAGRGAAGQRGRRGRGLSATARCSSPPICRPSSTTPGGSSSSRTARWPSCARDGAEFFTLDGEPLEPDIHTIPWDPVAAAKGEYKHFMQKEIYEQANSP